MESVVQGHHVYKQTWTPHVGEQLQLKHEEENNNNVRAVAIAKDGIIVGHLPRELARTFFLKRGGTGITGKRKKGKGLKVPCVYSFYGPSELVKKLKFLLQYKHSSNSCLY